MSLSPTVTACARGKAAKLLSPTNRVPGWVSILKWYYLLYSEVNSCDNLLTSAHQDMEMASNKVTEGGTGWVRLG